MMMAFGAIKTEMVADMRAMMRIPDAILLDWMWMRQGPWNLSQA